MRPTKDWTLHIHIIVCQLLATQTLKPSNCRLRMQQARQLHRQIHSAAECQPRTMVIASVQTCTCALKAMRVGGVVYVFFTTLFWMLLRCRRRFITESFAHVDCYDYIRGRFERPLLWTLPEAGLHQKISIPLSHSWQSWEWLWPHPSISLGEMDPFWFAFLGHLDWASLKVHWRSFWSQTQSSRSM